MSVNILNINSGTHSEKAAHTFLVSFYLLLSARSFFRPGFGLIPAPDRAALAPNHKQRCGKLSLCCLGLSQLPAQELKISLLFPFTSHGVDLRIKACLVQEAGF